MNVGVRAGDGAVLVAAVQAVVGEGPRDVGGLGVGALSASMEKAAAGLAVAAEIIVGGEHGYFFCLR